MGIFNWAKKKGENAKDFGEKIVGAEDIKGSYSDISKMAKILLSPKDAIENARKETFLQAKERLKVNDIQIKLNYKNMVYGFYISFAFSIFCFFSMLYNLFIHKSILSSLTMLAIFAMCLANSFKYSFRAFQIKHQKLCSVNEWWERAGEWFPKFPK